MVDDIVMGLAFANVLSRQTAKEARGFILEEATDWEAYEPAPLPAGDLRAGALDLQFIGSVASIASLLWMAYDHFIKPKKKLPSDDAGIYVAIRRPDGSVKDFWLGKKYLSGEEFVRALTKAIAEVRAVDPAGFWEEAVAEVRGSKTWVRIPTPHQGDQSEGSTSP